MPERRPLDPDFAPDERLYHALQPSAYAEDGLIPENLVAANVSVDRERHGGSPASVLKPSGREAWGVIEWRAHAVTETFQRAEGVNVVIAPEDDPLPDNPAHAEIRARRMDPERTQLRPNQLSKELKRRIREHLANKATVLEPPRQSGP